MNPNYSLPCSYIMTKNITIEKTKLTKFAGDIITCYQLKLVYDVEARITLRIQACIVFFNILCICLE